MPTNPHHQQSFGTFEGVPSADQLRLYFQLTDFDRALIDEMRSATTKLGFAVQLSSVRFLGTFPTNLQQVPAEVIDYLAKQLTIDGRALAGYTRKMTISQHMTLIKRKYHYQAFTDPAVKASLNDWLLERARFTTETEKLLFDMLLKKCLDEKILLPGVTTFERFINGVTEVAADLLDSQLVAVPSVEETDRLLNLLTAVGEPIYGATIKMDLLRNPLMDESRKEINRGFTRLKQFQQFKTEDWQLGAIPAGKLKNLANYAFKAKASLIKRMSVKRQTALLVAFVSEYRKRAMDEQLLALSRFYETLFKRAKKKEAKERLRTIKDLDHAALTLSQIVRLLMDETISSQDLRNKVLATYPPEIIESAVTQVNQLVRNEREPIAIEELLNAYRKFRKFIPDILATIVFEGTINGQDCLIVWEFIRQRFPRPVTYRMFEQIAEKLPKKWRYYIRENPKVTNQCVLIAGIELLVHGLKRHDIYVRQSNRYLDPMACLIDKSTWRQQKAVLIQQLDLPQTGQAAVEAVKQDLALSYAETLKIGLIQRWPRSKRLMAKKKLLWPNYAKPVNKRTKRPLKVGFGI